MRWHVQGTDSVSGRDVELTVHEERATQAVRTAIGRQIVVSAIRPLRTARARWTVPLTLALLLALAGVGVGLYAQNGAFRGKLDRAYDEQRRLAASLEQAQRTIESLRAEDHLAQAAATQAAQLAGELAATRTRAALTEQRLSEAHRRLADLEPAAQKAPALEAQLVAGRAELDAARKQLQDSQTLAGALRTELAMRGRRIEQLQNIKPPVDPAVAQAAELQKANGALAAEIGALQAETGALRAQMGALQAKMGASQAEIDTLSAELLLAAARPPDAPAPALPPEPAPPAPSHWALRISYDAAHAFLVLHADHNALAAAPAAGGEPWIATTGLLVANAVRMQIVHDRAREVVYGALLAASLAADAPPDKLAENKALIADFLRTFAPDFKDAGAVIAASAALAGQDASRKLVFTGTDHKVSLWNDKTGVYTFQVESSHEPE